MTSIANHAGTKGLFEGQIPVSLVEQRDGGILVAQLALQPLTAEVAVVGFVNKGVILQDFDLADSFTEKKIQSLIDSLLPNYEHLPAKIMRCGDLESGVQQSLCVLDSRKKLYQKYGIPYCQPMLVLMTDGVPTRGSGKNLEILDASRMKAMVADIEERRKSRKLSVISVYCARGSQEDKEAVDFLKKLINPNDEVYCIDDKQPKSFDKFFVFLSMSVSAASRGKAIDIKKFNANVEKTMAIGGPSDDIDVKNLEASFSDFYSDISEPATLDSSEEKGSSDPELEEYLKGFLGGD